MPPEPDAVSGLLTPWLPRQRWFAGKGAAPGVAEVIATADLDPGPYQDVVVRVHLVRAAGAVYQVPLTYRRERLAEPPAAVIGELDGWWVHDGPHDPAYVRALLTLIRDTGSVIGQRLALDGRRQRDGGPIDADAPSSVLSGEQSNTSIIVGAPSPSAIIVKVFRVLAHGDNPDVIVQSALAGAGVTQVPRPAGWLEGSWPDPTVPGGLARGHLAFAGEFLSGSEDAWRVATRAVTSDTPFTRQARELGEVTAQVHAALARALPVRPATGEVLNEVADGLLRRLEVAIAQVPQLAEVGPAAREVMNGVRRLSGVGDLQQVHGDYHLGQVLHSTERGWVLLDFEGEPLRPLAERLLPDLAARDVAGMLRSFDYAAGFASVGRPIDDPLVAGGRMWAEAARSAFLDGYAALGDDRLTALEDGRTLLRALELDKALYEVVYEAANRPEWVGIPLAAVHRLLDH